MTIYSLDIWNQSIVPFLVPLLLDLHAGFSGNFPQFIVTHTVTHKGFSFPCLLSLLHWQVHSLPLHHLGSTESEIDINNNDIDIGIDVKIGFIMWPKIPFPGIYLKEIIRVVRQNLWIFLYTRKIKLTWISKKGW